MKMTKKTVKIISLVLITLFIGLSGGAYYFYKTYKTHIRMSVAYQEKREQRYIDYEKSFNKQPNISDAFRLIDWYYNQKKNFEKAIFYGNECIRLGVEEIEIPAAFLVNYQLSVIHKANNNFELSKKHLLRALELDDQNRIIKNDWIKKEGLETVLSQEELSNIYELSNR